MSDEAEVVSKEKKVGFKQNFTVVSSVVNIFIFIDFFFPRQHHSYRDMNSRKTRIQYT